MARGRVMVPACHPAIDQMKYEIAAELGIVIEQPSRGGIAHLSGTHTEFSSELGSGSIATGGNGQGKHYWGNVSSRDAGAVGGQITKRLIQQTEQYFMG